MTGDQGHDPAARPLPAPPQRPQAHRRGVGRPGFLPPVEAPEGPREIPYGPPEEQALGGIWATATIVAASALVLSAFLPWVSARVVVSGFGQTLSQELTSEAGVNVDGTGQIVPVLALMAIAMTAWGLLARSPRICMLAAAPAALALISCGLFLIRLDRFRDEIASGRSSFAGLELSISYGWWVALATSLLVIGLSLAGPLSRRTRRPAPALSPDQS